MKVGDLVKVVENDMSLVIKTPGPKDNKFFDQIGTIVSSGTQPFLYQQWFKVLFSSGIYEARSDALEVIHESS
tara:strand:+ start:1155 stop:1373 length:219 start_codon:yes stop_codon:yes gene_type:complete